MKPLTRGELRALQALARASTSKEAAIMLGTTEQTLRNLATRGFKKLEVNNKVAAFRRLGWLRAPIVIPLDPEQDDNEEVVIDQASI